MTNQRYKELSDHLIAEYAYRVQYLDISNRYTWDIQKQHLLDLIRDIDDLICVFNAEDTTV